jgi:transcriptional regulator with PAS, ATPase and Fis domain
MTITQERELQSYDWPGNVRNPERFDQRGLPNGG